MKEKRYSPQYLKAVTVDRENYRIRFVLSSGVVDRHGEVIEQKGWRLENYIKNPVVLWGHDQSKFPIGKMENITNDGQLEGDVVFAYKENPDAQIAFELCAGGFLSSGSVGFMNLKWMYDETTDTLTLLENELYEFSIVNVPANPQALAKAIGEMESKNVDKKIIENVKAFQAKAQEDLANRFKNLGEETSAIEVQPEETPVVVEEEQPVVPVETATTEEEPVEPSADEVKAALEVIFKGSREVIRASVKELSNRLNDAVDTTKGVKKGYDVSHVNHLIRTLLGSR